MECYVEISYEYRHQTDEAVLIFDGDDEHWIPKSLIEDGFDIDYEAEDTINIEGWFAKQEGMI